MDPPLPVRLLFARGPQSRRLSSVGEAVGSSVCCDGARGARQSAQWQSLLVGARLVGVRDSRLRWQCDGSRLQCSRIAASVLPWQSAAWQCSCIAASVLPWQSAAWQCSRIAASVLP